MTAPPGAAPTLMQVSGMWCASCARAVQKILCRQPGVVDASVSFASGVAVVHHDPAVTSPARLREAITALGYPASPWSVGDHTDDSDLIARAQLRLAVGVLPAMWVMILQWARYLGDIEPAAQWPMAAVAGLLAVPVVFYSGGDLLRAGWRTLRVGVPGMDTLVSAGALASFALSGAALARGDHVVWFDTAVVLILAVSAGRLIEHTVRRRGMDAVRNLLDLSPELALRIDPETDQPVPVLADQIQSGERVQLAPGARLAVDGVVLSGRSEVSRAALTGEPLPAPVGPGDVVEAGCQNGGGVLTLRVTAPVGARRLDRIAGQVQAALDQRTELSSLAQRFSERLAPAVMALATLTAAGVWLLGAPAEDAILRGVTVLVITCPCALGLATPLVLAVTVGLAAQRGIIFRDADALQRAASVERVYFDKTGTLTEGRPDIIAVDAGRPDAVLALAAQAAAGSEHPLSKAIHRAAGSPAPLPGDRTDTPGRGVSWRRADGVEVRIGARDWMPEPPPLPAAAEATVWVSEGGTVLGRIRLHDPIRAEAADALAALRAQGLEAILLSGDQQARVDAAAAALGIAEAHGACTPEEKAGRLLAQSAFVGDGYNDAPALAAAHVGVAVAGATDAATAAAPITIQSPGLGRIADALLLARRSQQTMRQNLLLALAYNALAVPAAVVGLVTPEIAAIAMVLSSLTVTANTLRLRRRFRAGV